MLATFARTTATLAVLLAIVAASVPAASAATYTAGRTTTAGSSMFTGQQNVASATQVTTGTAGGTLSSISVYVGAVQAAPGNHMHVALYGDAADAPGQRIAQSAAQALQPNAWNSFAMPAASVSSSTRYWLGFNVDGYSTQVPIANVAGGRTVWRYPVGFGTWPAAFGAPNLGPQAQQYSIYATYASADVPPQPPVDGGSPGCGTPTVPGVTTRTITVAGVQRTYLLVVPPGLQANAPVPLIMGFHGGSGTSQEARQTYALEGSEPAIYVYPQAPYWPEAGGVGWNVDPNGVDFPYFDAMLTQVESQHCIATKRVFAAGKSNGGFFVNALACHRPAAIRAIASVAGGGPANSCNAPQPKAAMIVHGSNDTTVSLAAGAYSRDFWLTVNGYAGAGPVPVDPAPCVAYPGTINPVRWCQHSGGHVWPAWAGSGIRRFFLSLG